MEWLVVKLIWKLRSLAGKVSGMKDDIGVEKIVLWI